MPEVHAENKYSKHFLSKVIARIDFPNLLSDECFSELALGTAIEENFPLRGKDQVENRSNLNVFKKEGEAPTISEDIITLIRKEFVDSAGKNRCFISRQYIILDYDQYESFERLQNDFIKLVSVINGKQSDVVMSRLGLRYINTFNPDVFKLQKSYFSSEVNSILGFNSFDSMSLSRVMTHVEYICDDIRLTAKLGRYNRNYPGAIQKNDFVLDYDAFIQGSYRLSDVFPQKLINAHTMIQTAFESHITDKLRVVMT